MNLSPNLNPNLYFEDYSGLLTVFAPKPKNKDNTKKEKAKVTKVKSMH